MRIIANVTANKKLELVRMIRMQNQSDRNECREKEKFLYGYSPEKEYQKELYGTELAATANAYKGKERDEGLKGEDSIFFGFRIRFVFALLIMVLFVYMDKTENQLFGKSMEEIAFYLTSNVSLEESLEDTLNSFDL